MEVGLEVELCPGCRGMFFDTGELERVVGGSVVRLAPSVARPAPSARPLPCPSCHEVPLRPSAVDGGAELAVWDCRECSGTWVDGGTLPLLREAARRLRPSAIVAPLGDPATVAQPLTADLGADERLAGGDSVSPEAALPAGSRLGFDGPVARCFALPVALATAIAITSVPLGRLLATPFVIMIHELGHAVPAWLSGRAALPLPCGLTFWREEQSVFTALSMAFLLGVLGHRGLRERRPFPVVVAAVGLGLQLVLGLALSAERSRELVLAGGLAGELVLATALLVAFHFPLPDRLRWDFWRYVVLAPAAVTYVSAVRLWWDVRRDPRRMPMGSILHSGDGFGDLERLMNEYDWTVRTIVERYGTLSLVCTAVLLTFYVASVVRSLRPSTP